MRMENLLVRDVEHILNGRIYLVRFTFFSLLFVVLRWVESGDSFGDVWVFSRGTLQPGLHFYSLLRIDYRLCDFSKGRQ